MDAISKELSEKRYLLESWNTNIDYVSDDISHVMALIESKKQALAADPENQILQYELNGLQKNYDHYVEQLNAALRAKEVIGNNIVDFSNEIDALDKEYWALYKAIGA